MLLLNNPGNIRLGKSKFIGEVSPSVNPAFKQFISMPYGYRAMFVLLNNYAKHGYNTVAKIINRYAPANENNTAAYIDYICKMALHVNPDEFINVRRKQTATKLIYAMSEIENGVTPDMNEIEKGWELTGYDSESSAQPLKRGLLLMTALGLTAFVFKTKYYGINA